MAGRRAVDLALRAAPFVAAAVILHGLAFIVWDVGSRAPSDLVADIRKTLASRTALAGGVWQFLLGAVILMAGAMLMLSVTLVDVRREFAILETIAILAGLCIEMLIGGAVRELRRRPPG